MLSHVHEIFALCKEDINEQKKKNRNRNKILVIKFENNFSKKILF